MSTILANSLVAANGEATAISVAHWLTDIAASTDGPVSICLSGGGTPRILYRMLTEPPFLGRFPWSRVHWFWGDERFVAPDHPDSNYRMAREAMLELAPVRPLQIHAIDATRADAREAADAYEATLRAFQRDIRTPAGKDTLFDVVLLGLGEDGHTASLFPGTPTLSETGRLVDSIVGARPEPRITLTFPAIASSLHVAFIVCGSGKRDIVRQIRDGADVPAARVTSRGTISWFFDMAAADDIVSDSKRRAART